MSTRNPWLDVPAADYIGHMNSPEVDQISILNRLFREALERFLPADVLLLGCATGNGLDRIDPSVTRGVTVVDINPEYLARLRDQCPRPPFELTVECGDVMTREFRPDAHDLVYCGLLFEYIDWPRLIPAIGISLRDGGGFSIVLQRPSLVSPAVTPTPFASLARLEAVFRVVEPSAVVAVARAAGLELQLQRAQPLRSGKVFDVMHFEKAARRR